MLLCTGLVLNAGAQERPPDVDPNTKIEGGADLRGSGAEAGASAVPHDKNDKNMTQPEKRDPEKDKPISERRPQERERQEAVIPDRCLREDGRCVP